MENKTIVAIKTIDERNKRIFESELEQAISGMQSAGYVVEVQYKPVFNDGYAKDIYHCALVIGRD